MTDLRATAIVNWGEWIAKCPRCPNAEHCGPAAITGNVGGLTGATFTCSVCHLVCPAVWPPNVDDIAYLLSLRPDPTTRNWVPPETVHELLEENVAHGCVPAAIEAAPLWVVGDHVINLPALAAGERLAIASR